MNYYCYCLMAFGKLSPNMLCLNASSKFQNVRGDLATQLSWATARILATCLDPISPVNGLLLVRSAGHDILLLHGYLLRSIWK